MLQCSPDFVELGGSSELDSVNLATSQTLCGTETRPDKGLTVLCGSSTVRLVSSGEFDNSVTVLVKVNKTCASCLLYIPKNYAGGY